MKQYYEDRLAEVNAKLEEANAVVAEVVERSQGKEGDEFDALVDEVTAAQSTVNRYQKDADALQEMLGRLG